MVNTLGNGLIDIDIIKDVSFTRFTSYILFLYIILITNWQS